MESRAKENQKKTAGLIESIGFDFEKGKAAEPKERLIEFINLNLAAMGEPIFGEAKDFPALQMGQGLVAHFRAKDAHMGAALLPPIDQRIEAFLERYIGEWKGKLGIRLPGKVFNLTEHGLARALSLPAQGDYFKSDIIESFRVANGVLHNPVNDRRTTKGVFHVTEEGLPIPEDKKAVPVETFARLLAAALNPPESLMKLPFTYGQENEAKAWAGLMLRPLVCPEVPGHFKEKRMEVRFFAPGNMVCNLDFVESIFGNAGDPFVPQNDAGMDVEGWTGHTGCVILAPHMKELTKQELGLPHVSEATERQKRDGMCWENSSDKYNEGGAFKITARDKSGVVVTLIADNYFGYCKKEVKTQMSFAANLFGMSEEEHAGGTIALTSYDLGEDFRLDEYVSEEQHKFDDVLNLYGHRMRREPEGHGVDLQYPNILYIPEKAQFSLRDQTISWKRGGKQQVIKLLAGKTYVLPYGYRVCLQKPAKGRRWRLIGTMPEVFHCHKPCTVSGGGKSEISKSIGDAIIHAPFYVGNLKEDFDAVEEILHHDHSHRFREKGKNREIGRPLLSHERSLGSIIKLLTPSPEYTDEYNAYLHSIPTHIKELVCLVKRFYKSDWGENWRERFSVDIINGVSGHELKYRDGTVVTSYLRVGYAEDGSWRVFSLRKDFSPAVKMQTEDDITASVTVGWENLGGIVAERTDTRSGKVLLNCEYRLFQRPDDAIVRGYDKKTESDMSQDNNFLSNWHALTREEAKEIVEDAVRFDYFTEPMKRRIQDFVNDPEEKDSYLVCSAYPRIVDGKPSKNPRYLETRRSLEEPEANYLVDIATRMNRQIPEDLGVVHPVTAVLTGRRNNPPEGAIRSLAVFNPIHYMPLPEAFMEFTSSMTGKSPSTTGAGSEGALTKAPFNALLPITDLNNSLVSFALTGMNPFITAAGYVGPNFRVDHDISLLVPEIWSRMRGEEKEPHWLIEHGLLEKVPAMEFEGKDLPVEILGYRITMAFVTHFLGRIFTSPEKLFTEEMLKPELQGEAVFADGLDNMMTTHRIVAENYFADGSIEFACPPMKALLHIMRDGNYEGMTLQDQGVRKLFEPKEIIESDWYQSRLEAKHKADIHRWEDRVKYLETVQSHWKGLEDRRQAAKSRLEEIRSAEYRKFLDGTIGLDVAFH